jgi:hypothetical protein
MIGHPVAAKPSTSSALAQSAFGNLVADSDTAESPAAGEAPSEASSETTSASAKRPPATETLGRRAGALTDELDFSDFVASLVHGTFDAIVDSSIRQMESFADLVAAVSKPIGQFTEENVSLNQARDWLVERYPNDLELVRQPDGARISARGASEDGSPPSPAWLEEFGLGGEELTPDLIETQILPVARERAATDRLQTLSTMVLLGMNRVLVKEGTIAARLRFRASAADKSAVEYAVSDDPKTGGAEWGRRGSRAYSGAATKVSTIGVNAQSDTDLKAELFGEVRITFENQAVPLERFVDDARRVMLERHAKPARPNSLRADSTPVAPVLVTPAPVASPVNGAPAAVQPPSNGGRA